MTPEDQAIVRAAHSKELDRDVYSWIPGRLGSRKPQEMSLYVLTEGFSNCPCKIGSAADVNKRVTLLNCGNHRKLFLRASAKVAWPKDEKWLAYQRRVQKLEREVHKKFANWRVRGEWFVIDFEEAAKAITEAK